LTNCWGDIMATYEKGARHESSPNQSKIISPEAKEIQREAIGKVGDVLTAPLDVIKWLTSNWQIAVVGLIALFVLIRD